MKLILRLRCLITLFERAAENLSTRPPHLSWLGLFSNGLASILPAEYLAPTMPTIEKHAPGNFCWIELATTDQNAAISFYSKIFGWAANNMPMGPDDFYTIFRLEGSDAAAGCTLRPDQF